MMSLYIFEEDEMKTTSCEITSYLRDLRAAKISVWPLFIQTRILPRKGLRRVPLLISPSVPIQFCASYSTVQVPAHKNVSEERCGPSTISCSAKKRILVKPHR